MNKLIVRSLGGLLLAVFVTAGVFAQDVKKEVKEENHVKILIQKEGKAVLDTTFSVVGNLDNEFVNKLVKKYSGDQVNVNVFSSKEEMAEECDGDCSKSCEHEVDVDVKVEGEMIYITSTGEEGEHTINIKEILGDKVHGDAKVVVVKKVNGNGEAFEVLLDSDYNKKHNVKVIKKTDGHIWIDEEKDKNAIFFGDHGKDIHKEHGVNIVKSGHANFWVDDNDSNVVVDLKNLEAKGNVMFIEGEKMDFTKKGDFSFFEKAPKSAKKAITLDKVEGGLYELELNTDNLEPILVEVFNSTGDRLYKKKVKNYYGRFLQIIELEGNESAFYTVKVTQGEKEIIGEFEF